MPPAWPLISSRDLVARRFEAAIECADRSLLHGQRRVTTAFRIKVVANAHLGRLDEARAELRRLLTIDPKLTIAAVRVLFASAAPEFLELYVSGLRLAGLPEG
jgi:hypothetical protein